MKQKHTKPLLERLKHLRGRHDQLDHAWNRGMGRGSGGGVGDIVTVDQYQAMSKRLDEEVAAGTKTQEVANGIRKNLQAKANKYYDTITRASLGMARVPRRQRVSAQLADSRANDIASAAQQGQLSNRVYSIDFYNSIRDSPGLSLDVNDWKRWIDSFLPNDIDPQYREAIINGDRTAEKPDADIFIAAPVKLRKQAINDVSRGYQDEPPTVAIGGAQKREFPFPVDLGQTELLSLIEFYDKLDQEFEFSKWKLTENETTQNAQDAAQRTVKRNQELLIERIALASEYEKKYAEYKSIGDVVKKLDDASTFVYDKIEDYIDKIEKTGKKPDDTETNVIKQMRELASSLYASSKLAKNAYFNIKPVLQKLSDDIAKSDEELRLTSSGLRLSNQELDAFFDAHLGKSVNPDMQEGIYFPSVDYDEKFEEEMEAKGVDLRAVSAYVQSFMSKYVDARLHPTAEIKFGTYDSYLSGPHYTSYDDTVQMRGESGYMTASVLLHELAHAMEKAHPELQQITDAFFMSRVAKDPILTSTSDGTEYVKDDFPDWYCGLWGKGGDSQSVEVLSMGMSMLFTDPVRFAKEYPEYFRLVTSALSGSWIKDQILSSPNDNDYTDMFGNTQSQNIRANDIASAAQQGQYANVELLDTSYINRAPFSSTNENDWREYLMRIIPEGFRGNFDYDTGEGFYKVAYFDNPQNAQYLNIQNPEELTGEVMRMLVRGTQTKPMSVLTGEAKEKESILPKEYIDADKVEDWRKFSGSMGINDWSFESDEKTQSIIESAQKNIEAFNQTRASILADITAYEQEFLEYDTTVLEEHIDLLSKLDREVQRKTFDPKTTPELKSFLSMISDKIVDIQEHLANSITQGSESLRMKAEQIKKRRGEIDLLASGVDMSDPAIIDFFDSQLGKAVNPNMQQANFTPSVFVNFGMRTESRRAGVDLDQIMSKVNQFMQDYVDSRLHPKSIIRFDSSNIEGATGASFYGSSDPSVIIPNVADARANVVIHELMHAIEHEYPQVKEVIENFFQSRINADPRLVRAGMTSYLPDNFPDWYCGFTFADYKPIEILSMGASMLFTNPVRFAKEQPEYFRMVSTILSGKWLDQKQKTLTIKERVKHLRGRHDQRDHAWNRGMGRGDTSGGYAPGTMNQDQFMEMKRSLQAQIDSGSMSYEVGSAIWKRAQEIANQDYDARPENRRDLARESISQSRVDLIQEGAIAGTLSNRRFDQRVEDLKSMLQGVRNAYADYLETRDAEKEIAKKYARSDYPNPNPDFAYVEEYYALFKNINQAKRDLQLLIGAQNSDKENHIFDIKEIERKFPYDNWKQNEELTRLNKIHDKKMQEYDDKIAELQKELDSTLKTLFNNPIYVKREIVEPLGQKVLAAYNETNLTLERMAEIANLRNEYEKAQEILNVLEQNTAKSKRQKVVEKIRDFTKNVVLTINTDQALSVNPAEMMRRVAEIAKQLRESPDTQAENNRPDLLLNDEPSQAYIDSLDRLLQVHIEFSQLANYFANAIEMMREEARKPDEEGTIPWGAGENVVLEIFKILKADNPIPVNITENFQDPQISVGTRYNFAHRKEDVKDILSIVPDYSDIPYDVEFTDYESEHAYAERASAEYRKNKGKIYQGRHDNFGTIVHETLHLIQLRFPKLQQVLDEWAFDRVQKSGETPRKLSEITGNPGYDNNELSVVDQVDTPYTLKQYGMKYSEVLTTAFDRLSNLDFGTQDPEHIRIALYALLRYLPIARKTKSLKERVKHLRGRHDQLDHH